MASSIPRTHSTSSFDIPFATEPTATESVTTPPTRRTLHQMEQALTEWAKYPAPGENRMATKEKILAAYQNTPELLELENIGFTDTTLNLPRCLEGLNCEIKCTFLENKNAVITATGTFQYIPESKCIDLTEGTVQLKNGSIGTGTFQYIPELKSMDLTEGTIQFENGHIETGTFKYIPELKSMGLTEGTVQFENGHIETGKRQYIPELKNMGLTEGTKHNTEGRLEEGTFKYVKQKKQMELVEGIVTQPDGTREQRAHRKYSKQRKKMVYESKTPLPPVAPPGKPAKLVAPRPSTPTEASTSTQPTQAPPPVVNAANSSIQQLPEALQITLTQLNTMPLDKLHGFLLNDLPKVVTMPQLPEHLHRSEAHRNFFKGFTGLLNAHYFMLRAVSVKAIEEEAPLWVQGISMALQALPLPGTAVADGLLNQTAQLMPQAQAETKARAIIQQFASDLHFTVTARQAGVLLTQHMADVPEITHSFLKQAKRLFKKLGEKANLLAHNPYEHTPKVLDAYTLFLKTVKKHPEIMREVNNSNLSFQDHCETAATRLVAQGLGIAIEPVKAEGVQTFVEVREVPEVPTSEPAESSEVQRLKNEMVELKTLMKQVLEAQNTGGMAIAQTQRQTVGVGGEVYAAQAESSASAEQRLRIHSLQINELRAQMERLAPSVAQHNQTITALTATQAEFDLKGMVTASAHYLRRFGVINYANTPVTVRLANGREVELARKLEAVHNTLPNAGLKPYRPQVELKQLILALEASVRERANLRVQPGQGILGAVVAKRTSAVRVHDHNQDVVKMASYYLRRFGLVNYASGMATVQWAGKQHEVSVGTALAHIHREQGNPAGEPFNLDLLLDDLLMKLPNSTRKDRADIDLPENADLLLEIKTRMNSKRALQARSPVSLQEVALQTQEERQQLFMK